MAASDGGAQKPREDRMRGAPKPGSGEAVWFGHHRECDPILPDGLEKQVLRPSGSSHIALEQAIEVTPPTP